MAYFDVILTWQTRVGADSEFEAKEAACEVLSTELDELDHPLSTARYEVQEVR